MALRGAQCASLRDAHAQDRRQRSDPAGSCVPRTPPAAAVLLGSALAHLNSSGLLEEGQKDTLLFCSPSVRISMQVGSV